MSEIKSKHHTHISSFVSVSLLGQHIQLALVRYATNPMTSVTRATTAEIKSPFCREQVSVITKI